MQVPLSLSASMNQHLVFYPPLNGTAETKRHLPPSVTRLELLPVLTFFTQHIHVSTKRVPKLN